MSRRGGTQAPPGKPTPSSQAARQPSSQGAQQKATKGRRNCPQSTRHPQGTQGPQRRTQGQQVECVDRQPRPASDEQAADAGLGRGQRIPQHQLPRQAHQQRVSKGGRVDADVTQACRLGGAAGAGELWGGGLEGGAGFPAAQPRRGGPSIATKTQRVSAAPEAQAAAALTRRTQCQARQQGGAAGCRAVQRPPGGYLQQRVSVGAEALEARDAAKAARSTQHTARTGGGGAATWLLTGRSLRQPATPSGPQDARPPFPVPTHTSPRAEARRTQRGGGGTCR